MKVNVSVPTTLNEIKLKDYQKYHRLVTLETPLEITNLKMIEIFCGLKLNKVRDIKLSDFQILLDDLTKLFKQKPQFKDRFTLNGVEYGFIPDLEDIRTGEYLDIANYITDIKDAHKAMAVLYRPVIKSKGDLYAIEKYKGSSKYSGIMQEAPLDVTLGAQVFFYNLASDLLKSTLKSLEVEKDPQLLAGIVKNGDGTQLFMQSLKDNYGNLILSLN